MLSPEQIDRFVEDGFVRVDEAFSPATAAAARDLLWREIGADPADPRTWTRPVVRLGEHGEAPFAEAATAPRLGEAFDQLLGAGRWLPRRSLGSFPVRFPGHADPGDTGWHVDASFAGDDPTDYLRYRINARSRGRALLLLMLFSDVGEDDAPTRIRVGSHRQVAELLAGAGEAGLDFMELAGRLPALPPVDETLALGPAGTVYVCHPLLVHAAQPHRGRVPRFLAQPPILPRGEIDPASPVGRVLADYLPA